MDTASRAALAEAVNLLIDDPEAVRLFADMHKALELTRHGVALALTGRGAGLNPLLALATDDELGFDRVLELIDRKRQEHKLDPLGSSEPDRKAYMREFMATKRERQRQVITLLNELRSSHDQIRGTARIELERVHAARWIDEKDRREAKLRQDTGRRLTSEERKYVATQLWRDVGEELVRLEGWVRKEVKLPLHSRSKTGFQFSVGQLNKGK